ncbi:hypothetical protein B194_1084 [Serratia plymuthica A30]|nr:hypothetical protein B194_1084 [Serratia plymuthica A30]
MLYYNNNYAPHGRADQVQNAATGELMRVVCIKRMKQKKKAA